MATPCRKWEVIRNGIELRSGVPGHCGCDSGEIQINGMTRLGWQI